MNAGRGDGTRNTSSVGLTADTFPSRGRLNKEGRGMLNLQLRKQWFRMIHDGEKFEEYREIGEYWRTRFYHAGLLDAEGKPIKGAVADVILANGYGPKAPELLARITLRIGTGEPKWGAEPGREYYVLPILTYRRIR